MAKKEGQGIALVILGVVAIVAVIGLVLMFTQKGTPAGQYARVGYIGEGRYEGVAQTYCESVCFYPDGTERFGTSTCGQCVYGRLSSQQVTGYREQPTWANLPEGFR